MKVYVVVHKEPDEDAEVCGVFKEFSRARKKAMELCENAAELVGCPYTETVEEKDETYFALGDYDGQSYGSTWSVVS